MKYKIGQRISYHIHGIEFTDEIESFSKAIVGVLFTKEHAHAISMNSVIDILSDESFPYEIGNVVEFNKHGTLSVGRITDIDLDAGTCLIDRSFFVFFDEVIQKVEEEEQVYAELHASLLVLNQQHWKNHIIDKALAEGNEELFYQLMNEKEVST